jgi:hypothetical protein
MSKDSYCCKQCGIAMDNRRWYAGYTSCMACGDYDAMQARKSWCVVPMPKSNYILVTDATLLLGLNNSHKGGVK